MPITTPGEKFAYELSIVYDAEHRFLEAQQEMVARASDSTLKSVLEAHSRETEQQIKNLEQVFEFLGQPPERSMCSAAAGLITDGWKALQEVAGNPQIMDCMMVAAQAKVEHFEIGSYRGLVAGAELMGRQEALQLLQENLQQEERTAQVVEETGRTLLRETLQAHSVGG